MSTPLISVIDDDESVRYALDSLIRSLGYDAQLYASAQAFLDAPCSPAPACLILDVHLPGMSGPELQEQLLAQACAPPIIFITALPDLLTRNRALAAGALAFLSKPFEAPTIIYWVEKAVGICCG